MERKVEGGEESERRATKSWVWARAKAEERVPMCRIRFVCKSKELGGGGASGLVRVGRADDIFCPSLGREGLRSGGDAGLAGAIHFQISTEDIITRERIYVIPSFIALPPSIKYGESLNSTTSEGTNHKEGTPGIGIARKSPPEKSTTDILEVSFLFITLFHSGIIPQPSRRQR